MTRARWFVLVLVLGGSLATLLARAGEHGCARCGCACQCQKVCRVVCEMKEITKTTWTCKCEDFCVPGPSQRCHSGCSCGHCPECREHGWKPTAAYVKTRKTPVKHVEKVKVPSYRLVVEDLCPNCAQQTP